MKRNAYELFGGAWWESSKESLSVMPVACGDNRAISTASPSVMQMSTVSKLIYIPITDLKTYLGE